MKLHRHRTWAVQSYSGGYKDFQWKTIYRNIGDGSTNLLKANKELSKCTK